MPGYAQTQENLSSRVARTVFNKSTVQTVSKAAQDNNLPLLKVLVSMASSSYLAEQFFSQRYTYTHHALEEAFKMKNMPLFKKMSDPRRIGFNDKSKVLRFLVQRTEPEVLSYIMALVDYEYNHNYSGFWELINDRPCIGVTGPRVKTRPLDLAVRKDVRPYLEKHGARFGSDTRPPVFNSRHF